MKVKHLLGAFLCMLGCCACSSPKTEVQSPDGHIKDDIDGRRKRQTIL